MELCPWQMREGVRHEPYLGPSRRGDLFKFVQFLVLPLVLKMYVIQHFCNSVCQIVWWHYGRGHNFCSQKSRMPMGRIGIFLWGNCTPFHENQMGQTMSMTHLSKGMNQKVWGKLNSFKIEGWRGSKQWGTSVPASTGNFSLKIEGRGSES